MLFDVFILKLSFDFYSSVRFTCELIDLYKVSSLVVMFIYFADS